MFGFISGIFVLLGYMLWRMMRNPEWDDSNATNAIRLLSHVVLHPEDFAKMYYLKKDDEGKIIAYRRPFWYVDKDELSEVVNGRPEK